MLINILGLGDLADDTTPEFAWRVYVMDLYLNMFVDEDTLEQVSKMWDRWHKLLMPLLLKQ